MSILNVKKNQLNESNEHVEKSILPKINSICVCMYMCAHACTRSANYKREVLVAGQVRRGSVQFL